MSTAEGEAAEAAVPEDGNGHGHAGSVAALTLGALGVVFGDIGTSPLYAMHEVFAGPHTLAVRSAHVFGVLSLIFWSLTIIVTAKYVLFIMRADNEGEGGIMALISLVQRSPLASARGKLGLMALGIFGASLFYGDGMITPAISVLSAVEGLKTSSSTFGSSPDAVAPYVVPITLVIVVGLFTIQRFGTGAVGVLFGPVMVLWFSVLSIVGLREVAMHPGILRCLSPTYGAQFFADAPGTAFLALGSVVLAVTGAEALYADMGHFGRSPIRRAWFIGVLPALLLNYMGQGALLLAHPSYVDNPFYRAVPSWGRLPMVVLATVATIIASQAVISGAFSVTRQAVQLGYLPRLDLRHTSAQEIGQVYVPVVNWALCIAIVGLVLGFRSSSNLASAYGIAVTGTLAIDTILAFVVVRTMWRKPLPLVLAGAAFFLTVDLAFFAANTTKILHGGWFPLAIAAIVFTSLTTWRRGRALVTQRMKEDEQPLEQFLARCAAEPPTRVEGTAVFLSAIGAGTPRALQHNVEHNHVLHQHVVLFTATTLGVPTVPDEQRFTVDDLGHGIARVHATFGFQDDYDIPRVLQLAQDHGLDIDVTHASYFLNRVALLPTGRGGMARAPLREAAGPRRQQRCACCWFRSRRPVSPRNLRRVTKRSCTFGGRKT